MTTLAPEVNATLNIENHPMRRELNNSDRCDRCGAQAFAQIVIPRDAQVDGELLFCGHHFRNHSPALLAKGYLVNDQTHKINEKGGASA